MSRVGFFVDLHMHSYWSFDGFSSPQQLLDRASTLQLSLVAITEHDNVDSWEKIRVLRHRYPTIQVVPGIEISAKWTHGVTGVLGIGLEPNDPRLRTFLSGVGQEDLAFLNRWYQAAHDLGLRDFRKIVDKWIRETFPDFPERLDRYVPEWILTRLLWTSGLVSSHDVAKKVNALIVANAKPPPLPGVTEVVEVIHHAGGIAIAEHPPKSMSLESFRQLMARGLDGVELFHRDVDPSFRREALAASEQTGWLISAGSDHHGMRDGWGRRGQLLPHPRAILNRLEEAMSYTSAGRRS
jgi:hypothetical protein